MNPKDPPSPPSPASAPSPPPAGEAAATLPEARATHNRWFGIVWAVPLAALAIVAFLGLRAFNERGIDVVVTFDNGAGAHVGDTKVIYQGVEGGEVTKIAIAEDGRHVEMTLRLDHCAGAVLTTTTRFFLIGAKPTLNDLSSLKSAISGPSIGVALGTGGTPTRRFIGASEPPMVLPDAKGRQFVLTTRLLGTARVASPIFFRGQEIGKVVGVRFVAPGDFKLDVFVNAPYEPLVMPNARFWISSPFQIALTDKGASANLEHAGALLKGAIELDLPGGVLFAVGPQSPAGSEFPLYESEGDATSGPTGPQVPYALRFNGPAGDMVAGAPVRLLGFKIGAVRSVALEVNAVTGAISTTVIAAIFPNKLRVAAPSDPNNAEAWRGATDATLNRLLARGHRARLVQKPPVVGGYVVSFDPVEGAPPARLLAGAPSVIPSVDSPDSIDQLTGQVSQLVAKVNRVPFEAIGEDVRRITSRLDKLVSSPQWTSSLQHLDNTLAQADQMMSEAAPQVGPLVAKLNRAADEVNGAAAAARGLLGGEGTSPDTSLTTAIQDLSDAARSIRALADDLDRHPDSLIRGRASEAAQTPPNGKPQ